MNSQNLIQMSMKNIHSILVCKLPTMCVKFSRSLLYAIKKINLYSKMKKKWSESIKKRKKWSELKDLNINYDAGAELKKDWSKCIHQLLQNLRRWIITD